MPPRRELAALALELVSRTSDPHWIHNLMGVLPAADAVLRQAGIHDPAPIYERMLGDAHLASQLDVRAAPVLSQEWRLEASDASRREDVRAAELCEAVLKALDVRQLVEDIHTAVPYGYSAVELMWAVVDGAWIPTQALRRPNRRIAWSAESYEPRLLTREKPFDGEALPERKLLITAHKPTAERPQGVALMNRCFWPWSFKVAGWKFWMTFAERFGLPWIHDDMPNGTPEEKIEARSRELAQAILDSVLVTAGGDKLTFHQAQAAGASDLFSHIIASADADISKALVGQTLTSSSGDGAGSYALGKVHDQVRNDLVDADRALVASSISRMLGWVTELNVAGARPPVFRWVDEDVPRQDWAVFIKAAKDAGVTVPTRWAHQKLNVPQPEKAEPTIPVVDFAVSAPLSQSDVDAAIAYTDSAVRAGVPSVQSALTALHHRGLSMIADGANVAELPELLSQANGGASAVETALFKVMLSAWIQGEVHETEVRDFALGGPIRWEDAERAFAGRVPMTREEFDQLTETVRAKAFTVSGVAEATVIASIQDRIERGLAAGEAATKIAASLPLNAGHAETVTLNAVHSAFSAGRFKAVQRVSRLRPYVRYSSAEDERVRPAHRALNGRVFRVDDPDIGAVWPPNGHRCRCTVETLSERQVKALGVEVESASRLPVDERAESGFGTHPLSVWQPMLSAMSAGLQAALLGRAQSRWASEGSRGAFDEFLAALGLSGLSGGQS
ncbi:MAG: DUF935 family protein [Myxococcales bacterium]|uniref:phage portal protein family protein n=1 Tax=Sediminibacterium sp. TaxID=1917865 RepID=UPI001DE0F2F0|nr:DUF935 family protein [Sediminibacterium sp.]MBT9485830.1 DUF935 family protein [Sediminibacterium sp.]MBT9556856.1 DUF935 family protein [Myxococcales bacterium]